MGFDNPIHIIFILILLLLVFGAKRLPEMGKSLGSGMRGFKEALSGELPDAPLAAVRPAPPEPLAAAASSLTAVPTLVDSDTPTPRVTVPAEEPHLATPA